MHNLARQIDHYQTSMAIRKLADDLARIGNEYHEYERRSEALDRLVREGEELGLYDDLKSSSSNTDNR
jgi:cobalamin biosynthesis Mg chelatase CobN